MHTKRSRRLWGTRFLLALFLMTLAINLFGAFLLTQPAKALESQNDNANWYDYQTIVVTDKDSPAHTAIFHEDDKYGASNDSQIGQNAVSQFTDNLSCATSQGWDPDLCDPTSQSSSPFKWVYFVGQSYTSYHHPGCGQTPLYPTDKTCNPWGDFSQDTDMCAIADNPDDAPVGVVAVPIAPDGTVYTGKDSGGSDVIPSINVAYKKGWGCPASGYQNLTLSTRPAVPKQRDPSLKMTWTSPNIISLQQAKGGEDLSQSGIAHNGNTEFDESALNGTQMTLTAITPATNLACAGMSAYITLNPYNDLYDPYNAVGSSYAHTTYGQLYAPVVPQGDNGVGAGANCQMTFIDWVPVTNQHPTDPAASASSSYSAVWTSGTTIQLTGNDPQQTAWGLEKGIGGGSTFTKSALTNNAMTLSHADTCASKPATMYINPYQAADTVALTVYDSKCAETASIVVRLTNVNPDTGITDTSGNTTSSNSTPISCPVNDALIGWVLCPIFDLAQTAVSKLNTLIENVLYVDTSQLFGPGSGLQTSYNTLRNVGISLLVLAGLVMVLSEAAGLDTFSAYTVRKALPRIVIAAIGMSLAWPLLDFAITLFNDLGSWVSDIIMLAAPHVANSSNPVQAVGGGIIDLFLGGAAAFVAGVSIPVVFTTLIGVAIGLFVGYAVLVVRQMLLILCIILAPLAIAASVLPGTERLWKLWRETLLGLLMMFPIVMGFLAAGAALASISKAAAINSSNGGALELIAIIAYFAPYFMIPRAFSMASGLMGNIYGALNNSTSGIRNGLRTYRNNQMQRNRASLRAADRLSNNTRLGRWLNNRGAEVMTGPGTMFGLQRRRARQAVTLQQGAAAAEAARNPLMQQLINDDDANAAMFLSGGRSGPLGAGIAGDRLRNLHSRVVNGERLWEEGWSENRVQNAVAQARAVGINATNFRASVQSLPANKARSLGTQRQTQVYRTDADGRVVRDPATGNPVVSRDFTPEVTQTINDTLADGANGNAAIRQDLGETFGFNARKGGRTDLAQFITGTQNPASVTPAAGWSRSSMAELAADSGGALQMHMDDVTARINDPARFVDPDDPNMSTEEQVAMAAGVQLMEMQNLLPHVSPDSQQVINRGFDALGYTGAARNAPAEEFIVRNLLGARAPAGFRGSALRTRARVYDSSVPGSERS